MKKLEQGGIGSAQIELVKSLPKKKQVVSPKSIESSNSGLWVIGETVIKDRDWRVIGILTDLTDAKNYVNKHKDCFIIERNFELNKISKKSSYRIWPE